MSEQRDVKVFISWSGDLGRDVAVALRGWLPLLFDRVRPWASDVDIAAGQRGLAQIEAELADTQFGIVVVTDVNQGAPWLNFEAGALSKTIVGDLDQRVVPLLVDLQGPSQLTGPLSQFQAKVADREGVKSMLRSLAAVAGIEDGVAVERFDTYWSRLEAKLAEAKQAVGQDHRASPRRNQADVLDEILLHVRQLRSANDQSTTDSVRAANKAIRRQREERAARRESVVKVAAEQYGIDVNAIRETLGGTTVVVAPAGDAATLSRTEEFRQYVRELFPGGARVVVAGEEPDT